jgi:hypothetical protein
LADNASYRARLRDAELVLEQHFGDPDVVERHSRAEQALMHSNLWAAVLNARPELVVLHAAMDELDSGFHNIASGLYREAYGNLRLSLELTMATVHFSVEELALRNWLRDKSDIVWSKLIRDDDKDKPFFSIDFVDAFNDDMGGRWNQFRKLANTLHRELSAHVHGAASRRRASRALVFNRDTALDWLDKCESAHLSWQYLMLARYSDHLKAMRPALSPAFLEMLATHFSDVSDAQPTLSDLGHKVVG